MQSFILPTTLTRFRGSCFKLCSKPYAFFIVFGLALFLWRKLFSVFSSSRSYLQLQGKNFLQDKAPLFWREYLSFFFSCSFVYFSQFFSEILVAPGYLHNTSHHQLRCRIDQRIHLQLRLYFVLCFGNIGGILHCMKTKLNSIITKHDPLDLF